MKIKKFEFEDMRCCIIGEVAQAHDGSLGAAHAYIDAIANTGADAVKFQTHIAAAESTQLEPWRIKFSLQDENRFSYWKRMEFTMNQWLGLRQHAEDRGLIFLSSPFSVEAVELLEKIGITAWKIASGEAGNLPLLECVAATKLPVMLSTGMSDLMETDRAVNVFQHAGIPFAVLQCTTAYPCPPEEIGLNLLNIYSKRYKCPVGLSDHSGTIYPSLAAAVLGVSVIEVHVTMSRETFGPDVSASVTTAELSQLVEGTRFIEKMMKVQRDKETLVKTVAPLREMFKKSLVARTYLHSGTVLELQHLAHKKPGTGLPYSSLDQLLGKRLRRSLEIDEMIKLEDVE